MEEFMVVNVEKRGLTYVCRAVRLDSEYNVIDELNFVSVEIYIIIYKLLGFGSGATWVTLSRHDLQPIRGILDVNGLGIKILYLVDAYKHVYSDKHTSTIAIKKECGSDVFDDAFGMYKDLFVNLGGAELLYYADVVETTATSPNLAVTGSLMLCQ